MHILVTNDDGVHAPGLAALVDAGVRSFKIEGRYKDAGYVKNITGHYRLLLDRILEERSAGAGEPLPSPTLPAGGEGVFTSPTWGGGREGESSHPTLSRASSGRTRPLSGR